jgi:hypothetical protein
MPATVIRTEKVKETDYPADVQESLKRALRETDWDAYWEEVSTRVAEEVDAYADARARSWEDCSRRLLL